MNQRKVIYSPRVCARGRGTTLLLAVSRQGRGLRPRALRRFALALKRVLPVVPGPEDENRKEIMRRMNLGLTCYYELRERTAKRLAEVK